MTPEQFKKWRKGMGYKSRDAAAEALGVSAGTIANYETGVRRDDPERVVEIPRTVILACAALEAGISEYPPRTSAYGFSGDLASKVVEVIEDAGYTLTPKAKR
ncbi:helix-turn-helix domain-containing protein [Pseudovibrio ascidiaceicola]|uniref:helix-turn-helix domain-containing protein n=1 Tax=Pseudovibrio ascidiaceicola TaxID=285279 RepID=UPI003D36E618